MDSPGSRASRALAVAREIGWLRLIVTALVVAALVTLCVIAGRWQYGRHVTRAEAIAEFESNHTAPVAAVEDVAPATDVPSWDTPDAGAGLPADAEWRTVTVTGTIDPDSVVELRNRAVDSAAALQYLAWVDLADGGSVLVNLGWAPASLSDETAPALASALPSGQVAFEGTLREFEPDDGRRDDGATRIVPAQVRAPSGAVVPGYVVAVADCATLCGDDGPLGEVPLPTLSLGPHLSYAWQWWAFAALVPVGAVLLTRRDLELKRSPGDPAPSPRVETKPSRRRARGLSDEEIEDAL